MISITLDWNEWVITFDKTSLSLQKDIDYHLMITHAKYESFGYKLL